LHAAAASADGGWLLGTTTMVLDKGNGPRCLGAVATAIGRNRGTDDPAEPQQPSPTRPKYLSCICILLVQCLEKYILFKLLILVDRYDIYY
jgi:hypothetical protein